MASLRVQGGCGGARHAHASKGLMHDAITSAPTNHTAISHSLDCPVPESEVFICHTLHQVKEDCIHYCLPGPVDGWSTLVASWLRAQTSATLIQAKQAHHSPTTVVGSPEGRLLMDQTLGRGWSREEGGERGRASQQSSRGVARARPGHSLGHGTSHSMSYAMGRSDGRPSHAKPSLENNRGFMGSLRPRRVRSA